MGGERTSRLPWVLAGLSLAMVAAGLVFLILGRETPQPATAFAVRGYGLPLSIVFAAAGVRVASRVPANPIGWLLLAAGAGIATQELARCRVRQLVTEHDRTRRLELDEQTRATRAQFGGKPRSWTLPQR